MLRCCRRDWISTSRRRLWTQQAASMGCLNRTLRATCVPVARCFPRYTLPNFPLPMGRPTSKSLRFQARGVSEDEVEDIEEESSSSVPLNRMSEPTLDRREEVDENEKDDEGTLTRRAGADAAWGAQSANTSVSIGTFPFSLLGWIVLSTRLAGTGLSTRVAPPSSSKLLRRRGTGEDAPSTETGIPFLWLGVVKSFCQPRETRNSGSPKVKLADSETAKCSFSNDTGNYV